MEAKIINHRILIGDMNDVIHNNHSIPTTLEEIEEDVWEPFVVFEQCSNFPFVHGIMAPSADEALQEVYTIIFESNGNDEEIELTVENLEF